MAAGQKLGGDYSVYQVLHAKKLARSRLVHTVASVTTSKQLQIISLNLLLLLAYSP